MVEKPPSTPEGLNLDTAPLNDPRPKHERQEDNGNTKINNGRRRPYQQ